MTGSRHRGSAVDQPPTVMIPHIVSRRFPRKLNNFCRSNVSRSFLLNFTKGKKDLSGRCRQGRGEVMTGTFSFDRTEAIMVVIVGARSVLRNFEFDF